MVFTPEPLTSSLAVKLNSVFEVTHSSSSPYFGVPIVFIVIGGSESGGIIENVPDQRLDNHNFTVRILQKFKLRETESGFQP